MTITREWIEEEKARLSKIYPSPGSEYDTVLDLWREAFDLALIGLAVRDKEPGLVEAMARIIEPTMEQPRNGAAAETASAALSAITAYRSE